MKIKKIARMIEDKCPLNYAFDRDNVGLIVGDSEREAAKILVTCDVDEFVAQEAADIGADMIISHHPLMFNAIKHLNEDNPEQRALRIMVKNDIAMYAAHTNLDVARGGLNDFMAEKLGLTDTEVIDFVCDRDGAAQGYGRIAKLDEKITLGELMERCKAAFDLDGGRFVGEPDDIISTVAINTGGGAGIMDLCIEKKADVFITGDIKYNPARDAYEHGMDLIDIAHYDTEKIVMEYFEKFFSDTDLQIVKSKANKRIFKIFS